MITGLRFNDDNPNVLYLVRESHTQTIVLPPNKNGCDIIPIHCVLDKTGYKFNFDGLIVVTTNFKRKVYHKGLLLIEN